jgi:hypothetical protein
VFSAAPDGVVDTRMPPFVDVFNSDRELCLLLPDAELTDDLRITIRIVLLEVIEQAAAPADHHQKAPTRCVVLLVGLEVFGQLADPLTQDCDLHFGRTRIAAMGAVLVDYVLFLLSSQH